MEGADRHDRSRASEAAAQIAAANVGVTLSLIAQPEDERELVLSSRVREAALDDGDTVLSPIEVALLREWLGRLAH